MAGGAIERGYRPRVSRSRAHFFNSSFVFCRIVCLASRRPLFFIVRRHPINRRRAAIASLSAGSPVAVIPRRLGVVALTSSYAPSLRSRIMGKRTKFPMRALITDEIDWTRYSPVYSFPALPIYRGALPTGTKVGGATRNHGGYTRTTVTQIS